MTEVVGDDEFSRGKNTKKEQKARAVKTKRDLHLMNKYDTYNHSLNAGITKYKCLPPV